MKTRPIVAQAHRESIRRFEERMQAERKMPVVTGRADMMISNGLINQPVILMIITYTIQAIAAQRAKETHELLLPLTNPARQIKSIVRIVIVCRNMTAINGWLRHWVLMTKIDLAYGEGPNQ